MVGSENDAVVAVSIVLLGTTLKNATSTQNLDSSPGVLALGVGKQDFLMLGTLTSHRLGCNTPNSFNPPVEGQWNLTHRPTCFRFETAEPDRDFVIWGQRCDVIWV